MVRWCGRRGWRGRTMAFQTPLTIAEVLKDISSNRYVLPAIQRKFEWKPKQITNLFDSLMREYPIGTFLFWHVEAERVEDFKFYKFMDDYHQRNKRRNEPWQPFGEANGVTAVLDGQQRLTALNIGLRGSYAWKRKWGRWDNPSAFPKRTLHLNLNAPASTVTDVESKYDFRFLTEDQVNASESDDRFHWFRVAEVRDWSDLFLEASAYLDDHSLEKNAHARLCLSRLWNLVHKDAVISYYRESEQDIEKVLNIFIRVNSGGTVLRYSDLLLSMATAAFATLDAREEIDDCVDELNEVMKGFAFTQDLVLKSCLVLTGVPSIGFKVRNFTTSNMSAIEGAWPHIREALRTAALILSRRMGYDAHTLTAGSVIIPIAHYVYRRGIEEHDIKKSRFNDDAAAIRDWTRRALLKRGTFGAGLDTTLQKARDVINQECIAGFSTAAMDAAFASIGRPLRFVEEELDDLLDSRGGSAFSVLALLFPDFGLTAEFHIDHVFPQRDFTIPKMRKLNLEPAEQQAILDRRDRVANLQFLTKTDNLEKAAKSPTAWLAGLSNSDRAARVGDADLGNVPDSMVGFIEWYEARRERMKTRLTELLGIALGSGMAGAEPE